MLIAPHLVGSLDVDAAYMSVRAAEDWGAKPMIHHVQILPRGTAQPERQLPGYVIAGVGAKGDDPHDPEFDVWMIIRTLTVDVELFNRSAEQPIRTVAVPTIWLSFDRLPDKSRVGRLIAEAYTNPATPFAIVKETLENRK